MACGILRTKAAGRDLGLSRDLRKVNPITGEFCP